MPPSSARRTPQSRKKSSASAVSRVRAQPRSSSSTCGGEERRRLPRRPRTADPRGGGERDVALLLGPDPESADDGRDLRAGARVSHRPGVDHLAQVLGGDLERLAVGEQEAHAREDRLVVANRRLRRAVLVSEPAQVAADELAERRLAVRLVLHRLPDDPGGLAERQVRSLAVRTAGAIEADDFAGRALHGRRLARLLEELELAKRVDLGPRLLGLSCHPRRMWDGPRQKLAPNSPRTRHRPRQCGRSCVRAPAPVARGDELMEAGLWDDH